MPALRNPRHERFARHYIELGKGRQAYIKAGYNVSAPEIADASASRLLRHAKVRRRLQEIADMAAKVTEDTLIQELEEARSSALANSQAGAAVQATMGKARITGHIIDRKETGQPGDFDRMNELELRQWIADHTAQTDTQAIALAELNSANGCDSASDTDIPVKRQTHDGTDTPQ